MIIRSLVLSLLIAGNISCSGHEKPDPSNITDTPSLEAPLDQEVTGSVQEEENPIVERTPLKPNEIPDVVKANLPKMFPNRVIINRSLLLTYADGSSLYMFAIEHEGKRMRVLFDKDGMYKGELKD